MAAGEGDIKEGGGGDGSSRAPRGADIPTVPRRERHPVSGRPPASAPRAATPRLIGGMFGRADVPARPAPPPFLDRRSLGFANARSGLRFVVDRLGPDRVWLPSYLCESILAALRPARAGLRFFEATPATRGDGRWIDGVRAGDVVVLIAYFGFPIDDDAARRVRQQGGIVVADACQALLTSPPGDDVDFIVYSPRKFVGVPDGGILVNRRDRDLGPVDLVPAPAAWRRRALRVFEERRAFDRHGGARAWFDGFRRVEAGQPVGSYAISVDSAALLRGGFDYPEIARRRRENFLALRDRLTEAALFRDLPEGVVPIGFPIAVPHRDRVRRVLFEQQIYPPIHWSTPDGVPDIHTGSRRLAGRVMTLPCDQRYGGDDMQRIAAAVNEALDTAGGRTPCP